MDAEQELPGGNMNRVVRVGDVVLRDAGDWSPTVHRHLRHLGSAGITGVPVPVSIDGGRETLGFVAGEVPRYPLPAWVWADEVLRGGARLLRRIHDASVGFPLDGARWQRPARIPQEVVCHNDFAPHNLVFDEGSVVGAIDFDMCSPGPRLWDIAYFATRAVPLTRATPDGAPSMSDARRRVGVILDAYGSDAGWDDVLRVAIIRLEDLADFSEAAADDRGRPELREHAAGYRADAEHLRRQR